MKTEETTIKATIWATSLEGNYHLMERAFDMAPHGWIKVKDIDVEVDPMTPDQLRTLMVGALRRKLDTMRANHHMAEQHVEQQIQDLLCLEHKQETAP